MLNLNIAIGKESLRILEEKIVRIYRLFTAVLALIVIACLSGVEGQYSMPPSIVTPNAASQYAQYYTMPKVSAPIPHISVPAQTAIAGMTPATIYLGPQQQPVPYSQYLANVNNAVGPSLWIQGVRSWTQYVTVPQGATVPLIAISPIGGNGYLGEILNGLSYNSNYYFYPNSQLTFYADTIGQHTLSVNINGQPSNQVTINVIAYVPPQKYLTHRHIGHNIGGYIDHGNRGRHSRWQG